MPKIASPKIEVVPISRLKPWNRNPRKNHAVDQIARSIEEFGYLAPIIVQAKTYRILAGHGRLEALKKKGEKKIPVIIANITDKQADLYTIADNKLTELAEWDFSSLAEILLEADHNNLDLSITGFDEEEIKRIMEWAPSDERQETDPVPELPKKAVSKRGDLWELGRHRILCGDSTNLDDVATLMGKAKACLMNTDPPYGIDFAALKKGMDGFNSLEKNGPIENDDLVDGAALQEFLEKVIRAALTHLTDNPALYLWHPMLTQGTFFAAAAAAAAADILIHRQIIWVKPHMVFTRSGMYHWKHELAFYGWIRGKPCPWYGDKTQTSVWELGEPTQDRQHPTQKPVALFETPMLNHTKPGEVCYEPFSGSGSQIIAGERQGRRVYAMEIEPRYVDVAVKRWQNFTKKIGKNLTREEVQIE